MLSILHFTCDILKTDLMVAATSWIKFTIPPCNMIIPSGLWIPEMCYEDAILFQPLQKAGDRQMGLVCPVVPKMAKITTYIMLEGKSLSSDTSLSIPVNVGILRFSDRDLLMCYHWGLGVSHFHAHQKFTSTVLDNQEAQEAIEDNDVYEEDRNPVSPRNADSDSAYKSDNSDFSLDDRDIEGWEEVESDIGSNFEGGGVDEVEYELEEDFVGI